MSPPVPWEPTVPGFQITVIMAAVFSFILLVCFAKASSLNPQVSHGHFDKDTSRTKGIYPNPKLIENQKVFNPRMDYDEWTPLGRGDPLKNDPTYDYVPPVLERVHYWMDPSKRTPDPPLPNSGVLVLGSRTESTFTTRPTTPRYQVYQSKDSQQADSRIDTSSILDPFFKLMEMSQFNFNGNNNNNNNHYKANRVQRPHYQTNKQRTQSPQALQRPPYTMLMPPPPPPPPLPQSTNFVRHVTTSPERTPPTTVATPPTSNLTLVAENVTTINPTVIANTENLFKQVAISMPEGAHLVENDIKLTKKPATMKTTTEEMVLPIVTMFHQKKPQEGHTTVKPKPVTADRTMKPPSETMTPPPRQTTYYTSQVPWTRESETRFSTVRATTMSPTTTTTITTKTNSLTTDPMFKHYKQPSEPIKGPFYLIIQGHSKVKTYGANKNPINRLLTSNEIKYDDDDDDGKKRRKSRRLRYDNAKDTLEGYNNVEVEALAEDFTLTEEKNLENLEDAFAKSVGGSSKKRYLGSESRRKRSASPSRRLLGLAEDRKVESKNPTESDKSDDLDLESLIAIGDDYDPEEVNAILRNEEGTQGSGFGNF